MSRGRTLSLLVLPGIWTGVWLVTVLTGVRPRGTALLGLVTLFAMTAVLGVILWPVTRPRPSHILRCGTRREDEPDERFARYRRQLERATSSPPSCAQALDTVVGLAHERLRCRHLGSGTPDFAQIDPTPAPLLAAVMHQRPTDRTRVSRQTLTDLVAAVEEL